MQGASINILRLALAYGFHDHGSTEERPASLFEAHLRVPNRSNSGLPCHVYCKFVISIGSGPHSLGLGRFLQFASTPPPPPLSQVLPPFSSVSCSCSVFVKMLSQARGSRVPGVLSRIRGRRKPWKKEHTSEGRGEVFLGITFYTQLMLTNFTTFQLIDSDLFDSCSLLACGMRVSRQIFPPPRLILLTYP